MNDDETERENNNHRVPGSKTELYELFSSLSGRFSQKLFRLQLELEDIKKVNTKNPKHLCICLEQYIETTNEIDVILEKIGKIMDEAEILVNDGDCDDESILENEEFSDYNQILDSIEELCSDDYEDAVLGDKLPGLHDKLKLFLKDISSYMRIRNESIKIFNKSLIDLDDLIKRRKNT